ncbi:MAG TPA: deiodinase-like protein [Bryobacterales bacterium]|nr:deiodinase-like protein [Bryobacterales bacterium]
MLLGALALSSQAVRAAPEAQEGPASRPARPARPGAQAARPGALLDPAIILKRWRTVADGLGLSDDQKKKVDSILDDADKNAADMAGEIKDLPPRERIQKVGPFLRGVHDQIVELLDDGQKEQFQQKTAPGGPLMALRQNLQKLDLSDEQKQKVRDLMMEMQGKARDLRESAGNPDEMREKMQGLQEELRDRLKEILTPEQQQKLRDLMGEQGNNEGRPAKRGAKAGAAAGADAGENMMKPGEMMKPDEATAEDHHAPAPKPAAEVEDALPAQTLHLGDAAPEFRLTGLDGKTFELSNMSGTPVVLEFGSYSCPVFRSHAAAMEKLRTQYSGRVRFLIVYTKEAHPVGGWEVERNKQEGIKVQQPTDLTGRKKLAEEAREKLNLATPILLDDMNDSTTTAYGGFPNGAVVIKDGQVVASEKWVDPPALKAAVDKALAARPTTRPAQE